MVQDRSFSESVLPELRCINGRSGRQYQTLDSDVVCMYGIRRKMRTEP